MSFLILSFGSLPGRVKLNKSTFAGSLEKKGTWPWQPAPGRSLQIPEKVETGSDTVEGVQWKGGGKIRGQKFQLSLQWLHYRTTDLF